MTVFILTRIIKDQNYTKIISVFESLELAEEIARKHIEFFNAMFPKRKIHIRNEINHPEKRISNPLSEEHIYCKTIWYRNAEDNDQNVTFKIEEFQVE